MVNRFYTIFTGHARLSVVSQVTPFAERERVWSRCNYRVVAEECNYQPLRLGSKLGMA